MFYGGSAGSGKSDLLLGLAHTAHRKSIIFRREYPQLKGIEDRADELFEKLGGYNRSDKIWRFHDGTIVEFGAVQLEKDKEKYQGRAHDLKCVGKGTLIRMADGSYKPIENIIVGDFVATLEGSKKVNRIYPNQIKNGVKIDCHNSDNEIIYSQIQSCEHQLLTSEGVWDSYDNFYWRGLFGFYESILIHDGVLFVAQLQQTSLSFLQHHAKILLYLFHMIKQSQLLLDHQYLLETFSVLGVQGDRNDFLLFEYQLLIVELHFLKNVLLEHQLPFVLLFLLDYVPYFVSHDKPYVHKRSLFLSFLRNYLGDFHLYDEHIHEFCNQNFEQVFAQACPQQSTDVGLHIPKHSEDDALDIVQKCSPQKREYVHPYKKDKSQSQVDTIFCSIKYTPVGLVDLYDIEVDGANHYISGTAGIINKNCFDEITHFTRSQFQFLIGWTRSTVPRQRTRVICTGNPPTSAEGDWVIDYWGPWLDERHTNPALPGELRWFTNIDGRDVEVISGDPFTHNGSLIKPMSRTFIPGKIDDNPYLRDSGYKATLQALPKELREKLLDGKFTGMREDALGQVIPSAWVELAQQRWLMRSKPNIAMSALGVDVARGGGDKTILSPRYANYFDEQIDYPGSSTPDGPVVAALVLKHLEHIGTDVNIDVIGVGTSPYDTLKAFKKNIFPMNSAAGSDKTDKSGLFGFINKRAEWWWGLRESLDPEHGDDLALPPSRELLADLTAPTYKVTVRGIQVEPKADIISRIGRSPDKGDSLVYAHAIEKSGLTFDSI